MSSAFQLSPSVATLPLSLLRKRYEDMTPEERIAAGLVRPATQAEFDASQGGSGAPADFAGRVFPNPDNVQISDDTDSGIPALRLPNGVSATTGAYNGTPKLDTSNPAQAQVLPAAMQTVGAKTTPDEHGPWEDYSAKSTPESGPWDDYAPKQQAAASKTEKQPGWLDREIPLDSYWHANLQALQNIGRGLKQAGEGAWELSKPPESKEEWAAFTAGGPFGLMTYRSNKGLVSTAKQAAEVPAAIHEINQGPDPLGVYGKVAGRTAGEGAGQTLAALATEATGKVAGAAQDEAVVAGTKAAVKKVIPAAVKRIPYAGKVAADVAQAAKTAYSETKAAQAARNVTTTPVEDLEGVTSSQTESAGETPAEQVPPDTKQTASAQDRARSGASAREQARARAVGRTRAKSADVETDEDFREDGTSSQTESAGETPDEHVPEETPQKKTLADLAKPADTSPKNLNRLLKTATGAAPEAPKTVPGVKIKNQPAAQPALPVDFTVSPKESSVLRGYKYNAAAQELDGITNTGARYRHGQVTPDQFAQFEKDAADSPGKAWNNLRNAPGVEPLGKVDANGKLTPRVKPQSMRSAEVDPETGQPEFSDVLAQKKKNLSDFIKPSEPQAKAAAKPATKKLSDLSGEGDLTSLLKDSVKQATNKSAGVPKSAYDQAINDAMKEGPAWTPEKAKPVVDALNKNEGVEFEARGSVGEGRSTENDLDLYQKSGDLSDAHATLKKLGFKYNGKTPHGETWTNGAQHIDLWDSEHEPIKGYKGKAVEKQRPQPRS